MYEDYITYLQEKYHFEACDYSISVDEGFSVSVVLTSKQIQLFNIRSAELKSFQLKAEMYSASRSGIPLGMVPKTSIFGKGNMLKIIGSPDTIDALFIQLFSEEN